MPMWAEQERRGRSERQGELGAEVTDNRKRVQIQQVCNDGESMEVPPVDKEKEVVVLDGENELADRRGAAAGPEEDPGTHRGDSGVENPVGRVNPVDTEQEPLLSLWIQSTNLWCLKGWCLFKRRREEESSCQPNFTSSDASIHQGP